jgi:nucleoside-diphosphate-sugar epimerase
VGSAAADAFHRAGWLVEGWTNSPASAAQLLDKPYPVSAVDLTDRTQVNARPQNFDLVIHCASTRGGDAESYRRLYLGGTQNLADRFVGATLLFTSSTSVYAQTEGEWVDESSAVRPAHERGELLVQAEQLVLARGGIAARVAGIHGPARSALLTRFLSGKASVDPAADRFVNQVHRDDVVTALLKLSEMSLPGSAVYNIVDDTPLLRSECYRWLAQRLRRPVPGGAADGGEPKRGRSNKRVSNARLRGCGWEPRYPSFSVAMEQSILPSYGL